MPQRSSLVAALLTLRHERRSGVVAIRAEGIRTFVYLFRGDPVFAEEESVGETLGRLLVRQNKLTQAQYVEIIERMTAALIDNEQLRFGEIAVELGLLTPIEVQRALADQVRWKIIRALQRTEHEFAFTESSGQVDAVVHLPLVLEALILEACRWIPDERKIEVVASVPQDAYPRLREPLPFVARRYLTTPDETAFLSCIDGTKTMSALMDLGKNSEADVPSLLSALLWSQGVQLATDTTPKPADATLATPTPIKPIQPIPGGAPPLPSDDGRVHRGTVATPLQFVPFKGQAVVPASKEAPSVRDAAKERADRAMALLRQQRGKIGPPTAPTAFVPGGAPPPGPPAPVPRDEHEVRLLAEQKFQRGKVHLFAGQYRVAKNELDRARELMPASVEYELFATWAAFMSESQSDDARGSLKRLSTAAIKADPNSAFGYFVMGEMALLEKNEAVARRAFTHAVKLDPNLVDAQRRLRLLSRK